MKRLRKRVVLPALAAFALLGAGVAYALTSANFEPRAMAWQAAACNQTLLNTKESLATNQKIALCYALSKAQEHDAAIATLQGKVANLESQIASAPTDFTFFAGGPPETQVSPVFDARGFARVAISDECLASEGPRYLRLEGSQDGSTWIYVGHVYCGSTESPTTFSLSARYVRMNIEGLGIQKLRAWGRFS